MNSTSCASAVPFQSSQRDGKTEYPCETCLTFKCSHRENLDSTDDNKQSDAAAESLSLSQSRTSKRSTFEKAPALKKKKLSKQSRNECELCGEFFASCKSLEMHKNSAHNGWNEPVDGLAVGTCFETFACSVCRNAYRSQAALRLHAENHARYPYTCNFCGTGVSKLETLQKHRVEHARMFQCACGKVFSCRKSLQRHKKAWCASAKRKRREFYCPVCNELFASVNLRKKHIEEKHLGFTTCKECGMDFSSSGLYSQHVCSESSTDLKYFCDFCPKRFISFPKLVGHLQQIHHKGGAGNRQTLQAAAEAEQEGKTKEDLFAELFVSMKKDGKKKNKYNSLCEFKCDFCPKIFTCRYAFQNHQLFHAGDESLTCKYCGKTLGHKGSLMSHLRIHQGDRPFICEVCGKKFVEKSQLTRHVRIHTGERPYVCDKCGQTFNQPSSLKTHLRTHEQHESRQAPPRRPRKTARSGGARQKKTEEHASVQAFPTEQEAGLKNVEPFVGSNAGNLSSLHQLHYTPNPQTAPHASNFPNSQNNQHATNVSEPHTTLHTSHAPNLQCTLHTPNATVPQNVQHSHSFQPPQFEHQSTLAVATSTDLLRPSVAPCTLVSAGMTQAAGLAAPAPQPPGAPTIPAGILPPQAAMETPLSGLAPPQPVMVTPQSVVMAPQAVTVTSQSMTVTPHSVIMTPQLMTVTSQPAITTPQSMAVTPQSVIMTPQAAVVMPLPSIVVTLPENLSQSVCQSVAAPVSQMLSQVVLGAVSELQHGDLRQLAGSVGQSVSHRLAGQLASLASEELPQLMMEFFQQVLPLAAQQPPPGSHPA